MNENKVKYLTDTIEEKDQFEVHTSIAETVVDIVDNLDVKQTPFNLGLFGTWGSGKSFIINEIENKLKNRKDIFFVNISVWKFLKEPLLRGILLAIDKKLTEKKIDFKINDRTIEELLYRGEIKTKSHYKWQDLAVLCGLMLLALYFSTFKYVSFALSGILTLYFIKTIFNEFVKQSMTKKITTYKGYPTFSHEQFENIFKDIIKKISDKKMKMVIVFDDIDRCEPDFTYEVLSTIKSFMGEKNCFYIIPCDDDALNYYFRKKFPAFFNEIEDLGDTKTKENDDAENSKDFYNEFIDKLFDTYIRIPNLKISDRKEFIKNCFAETNLDKEIEKTYDAIAVKDILDILFEAYKGLTPRQVKRSINDFITYYKLAQKIDKDKKYLLDNIRFFTVMMSIKQCYPKFENKLVDNILYFSNEQNYVNPSNKDEATNFISSIQQFINKDKSLNPYLFLKASENGLEIIERLKSGYDFSKNLNLEIINIINKYTSRLDYRLDGYGKENYNERHIEYRNIFTSIFNTIINSDRSNKILIDLKNTFWDFVNRNQYFYVVFPEISENFGDFLVMLDKQAIPLKSNLISSIFQALDKNHSDCLVDDDVVLKLIPFVLNEQYYKFSKQYLQKLILGNYSYKKEFGRQVFELMSEEQLKNFISEDLLKKIVADNDILSVKKIGIDKFGESHIKSIVKSFMEHLKGCLSFAGTATIRKPALRAGNSMPSESPRYFNILINSQLIEYLDVLDIKLIDENNQKDLNDYIAKNIQYLSPKNIDASLKINNHSTNYYIAAFIMKIIDYINSDEAINAIKDLLERIKDSNDEELKIVFCNELESNEAFDKPIIKEFLAEHPTFIDEIKSKMAEGQKISEILEIPSEHN